MHQYIHLLKLDKDFSHEELVGLLDGKVTIQSKLDGTNSSMQCYYDGVMHYYSRTREITPYDDNAGFAQYMSTSQDAEIVSLRNFMEHHMQYIVYGEWLGAPNGKMVGTIKKYLHKGFYVFDVFDITFGRYLSYDEYYPMMTEVYDKVIPRIVELDHPTYDDIIKYLEVDHYNLPNDVQEEGIVIKNYDFRDNYGHYQIGKIIHDEFYGLKKNNHIRKQENQSDHDYEEEFVTVACTNSFISKCQNKVMTALSVDTWKNDSKSISFLMSLCMTDLMEEEFWSFFKKHITTVDLSKIRYNVQRSVREYLGL